MRATIQCAGNRRTGFDVAQKPLGLRWGAGAIGNGVFTGVGIRDLLAKAGVPVDRPSEELLRSHLHFEGADGDSKQHFAASIPMTKALSREGGDVVVAYDYEGEPLTRDHGFPIRIVVPGTIGARSVKWVTRMAIRPEENQGHWMVNAYKVPLSLTHSLLL